MEAAARTAGDGGRGDAMRRVLVDADRVHRDAYVDPAVFACELRTFWASTWQYLGHASQVPNAGDFVSLDLAGRPIVMVRGAAGACAETTLNETVRRTQMRARERMVASG